MAEAITKYMDKDGNELTEAEYKEIQEMVAETLKPGDQKSDVRGQKSDKTKK